MPSAQDGLRRYWERLRQQGLWPVPIWIPAVGAPESAHDASAHEAHRESAPVATGEYDLDHDVIVDDEVPDGWFEAF